MPPAVAPEPEAMVTHVAGVSSVAVPELPADTVASDVAPPAPAGTGVHPAIATGHSAGDADAPVPGAGASPPGPPGGPEPPEIDLVAEDGDEEILLVFEVVVEGCLVDPRGVGCLIQ